MRFRNLIHRLSKDRIVILSTHIVSDIESIADWIILIQNHKITGCETPAGICDRLRGMVYEVPAGTGLLGDDFLLSERQGESGPVQRVVTKRRIDGAKPVMPGLEDAFLYMYRSQEE